MSTIAVAKSSMNWQPASQRPACQHCTFAELIEAPFSVAQKTRCHKGGFLTSPMAICDEYTRSLDHA